VRLAHLLKMTLIEFVMKICLVREDQASVKIPGGEVKVPCDACKAKCVEQQVTLHSFSNVFKHLFKNIIIVTMNMKLWTTDFLKSNT